MILIVIKKLLIKIFLIFKSRFSYISYNLILILNQKTKKISYWKLFPGSVHDKTALEYLINKKNINKDSNIYLDKGFTGIDKILPNAKIPKKIYKNKKFSDLDKKNNYKINSIRSLIERIICILKNKSYILKYICRFGFKYLTKIIDFFIMNYNYEISFKKK